MGQALIDAPRGDIAGEQFIAARDACLRVRVAGSGPVLVLLHGWALDLDMWAPQFEALTDAYRLVAFDRRGFGLSTGAPSIERDVEDLGLLLELLDVERAALLGMSQGARVALRFALEAPQRTACLILDGTPPLLSAQSADVPLDHFRELVRSEGLDAFRNVWRRHPLMSLCSDDVRARALLAGMIARYRGADLQAAEPTTRATSLLELQRLQKPTLLINGALDSAERLDVGATLASCLPDAASVRIAGAAHLPNLDQADAYNDALRAFLRRCAQSETSWSERCKRTSV
jgi:3-oxoadipate enol-lactonase